MVSVKTINVILTLSSMVGLGLSIYAYAVEITGEHSENYVAMCDISEKVSCSKAFKSRYGKGFGLTDENSVFNKPNSLLGIVFYSMLIVLVQNNSKVLTKACLVSIVLSNLASIYFAYILYFILHTLCLVCVSTYVVNFVNFVAIYYKCQSLSEVKKSKEE